MKANVRKEVKSLIQTLNLNCSVEEFPTKISWRYLSASPQLSEDFIREFKDKVNWVSIFKYQKLSEDFIREFKDKVNWLYISKYQKLSEKFIREFKDRVNWCYISVYQKLSEDFIREFKDRVDWYCISKHQKLSEDFIREFKDKVNWLYISKYQKLSEDFIREFKDRVDWYCISKYQKLSEKFMRKFQDKVYPISQYEHHTEKSFSQKRREVKAYAKNYGLKIDKKYLYAFRNHDKNGCGVYNKTIVYKKGVYYRDWHCDMSAKTLNSFGLGIWPKGDTPVRVKIADWGVAVANDYNGKARVWGFEIIDNPA